MNSKPPYGYTPNEQGAGYQINPREAQEVRRQFEQAAAGNIAIYAHTSAPARKPHPNAPRSTPA